MKKNKVLKLALLSVLSAATMISVTACQEPNPTVDGITISSQNSLRTIKVGDTLQLTAVVFPEEVSQSVSWTSENETIATIDSTGLVTGVGVGNVNLIATSTVDTTITQRFALIVEEADEVVVEPESIVISAANDATSVKAGATLQLTATVYPADANQSVEWTSSDETIASVSRGVVTGLKEGSVTITATAKDYSDISSSYQLTVEQGDGVVTTKDWANMEFSDHETYVTAENDTPLKIKGIVTYACPVTEDGTVNYYIQNGTEGFYVYKQDAINFPVQQGKVYEIGGFKTYYRGLQEIVDVEYCKASTDFVSMITSDLSGLDVESVDAMAYLHGSLVSADAVITEVPSNVTKAFSVGVAIDEKNIDLRVDPNCSTAEDFSALASAFSTCIVGGKLTFTGFMSAYGYSASSTNNQITIVKPNDVIFDTISDADLVAAAKLELAIVGSINSTTNSITLPTSVGSYEGVSVSWVSDNDAINTQTGTVTHGENDIVANLTATITKGSAREEKTFKVFVLGNATYETLVNFDLEDAEPANQYGNSASKSGYQEGTVELGSPKYVWMLRNALIACTSYDVYDGTMGIRMQCNTTDETTGRLEIKSAGEYNYVQFDASIYGNDDTGTQIGVAYTTDDGATWVDSGTIITLTNRELETYRVSLPTGNKRIAIYLVANSGRRVNIDNIKLLK